MNFTHGRLWKLTASSVLDQDQQMACSSLKNVKRSFLNPLFFFLLTTSNLWRKGEAGSLLLSQANAKIYKIFLLTCTSGSEQNKGLEHFRAP